MPKHGPIVIIEDDVEDQMLLKNALRKAEVWNPLVFFTNGPEAYDYLKNASVPPFLIFCDVNLPRQNGIEFKTELDNDPVLRSKPIPFIFYTTYVSQYAVNEAYKNLTVQGFFQKQNNYEDFNTVIKIIIQYWTLCRQPDFSASNSFSQSNNEK